MLGQALRGIRLMELANVVEKAPRGLPVKKVAEWSHEDLVKKLTHFSVLQRYEPWVTSQGEWCGDLSVWAYRLYSATAELSFGPDARASGPVAPSAFLGLGLMEGVAFFEALVSPGVPSEPDIDALRGTLTPEVASGVLRRVAGGVFPSVAWETVYVSLGLDALLDVTESSQDGISVGEAMQARRPVMVSEPMGGGKASRNKAEPRTSGAGVGPSSGPVKQPLHNNPEHRRRHFVTISIQPRPGRVSRAVLLVLLIV